LNEVAKEVCADLDLVIADKKAVLNMEVLPVIHGDIGMMRQLFGNIIGNSLKYSKIDTPPVIGITCAIRDSYVEIAFKDNGIGFDEKYLSQMFTLFQRLHGRDSYEGTGLGLAICRKIVDLHQGRIWAEAKEGQGAVFYVSLPAGLQ
jgi:light-regulated signal transduction histidine kinase (bacteriophytochrome)